MYSLQEQSFSKATAGDGGKEGGREGRWRREGGKEEKEGGKEKEETRNFQY